MDDERINAIKRSRISIFEKARDVWKICMAENCGHEELANQYRKEYDFKYRREEGTPV